LRSSFEHRLSDLLTRFEEISWLDIYPKAADPYDLIVYLNMFRQRKATDPLDRVYGLLGLDSNPDALALCPEYSKSTAEVFEATALELARRTPQFELFTLCGEILFKYYWNSFLGPRLDHISGRDSIPRPQWPTRSYDYGRLQSRYRLTESLCVDIPRKAAVHGVVVDNITSVADSEVPISQPKDLRLDIYKTWKILADGNGTMNEQYLNQNMSRWDAFQLTVLVGVFPAINSKNGTGQCPQCPRREHIQKVVDMDGDPKPVL
jgi:hypothetical protein